MIGGVIIGDFLANWRDRMAEPLECTFPVVRWGNRAVYAVYAAYTVYTVATFVAWLPQEADGSYPRSTGSCWRFWARGRSAAEAACISSLVRPPAPDGARLVVCVPSPCVPSLVHLCLCAVVCALGEARRPSPLTAPGRTNTGHLPPGCAEVSTLFSVVR